MAATTNIDPRALTDMTSYLRDISKRTQASRAQTVRRAKEIIEGFRRELARRQRYVNQLEHEYDRDKRNGDDCSDVYQRLQKASLALDRAKRAQRSAEDALRQFQAAETRTEQRLLQVIEAGVDTLKRLQGHLDAYQAFSPLRALTASAVPPGRERARSLSHTAQTWQTITRKGRALQVFDHPTQSVRNAVIRQGSARPGSYEGTCGLCAVGSLLRKAGLSWDEGQMIDCAVSLGQCVTGLNSRKNGGTSATNLVNLLERTGDISSQCSAGSTLSELAGRVESGRGVIIGVEASLINPDWYGAYDPNKGSGHWIELASVVRDAATRKIVGFVITDSNGSDYRSACRLIPARRLKAAFEANGAVSVVTDQIIW